MTEGFISVLVLTARVNSSFRDMSAVVVWNKVDEPSGGVTQGAVL